MRQCDRELEFCANNRDSGERNKVVLTEALENADEFAAAKGYMAKQVARAIQRCSVLWMPDTAHDIQLQRPQTLSTAINNFIK